MSIAEKLISDFNYLYDECVADFKNNPAMNAHRYAVCLQTYCLLEENGFEIPQLDEATQKQILKLSNFFDTFYNYWVDEDKEFKSSITAHLNKFLTSI